MSVLFIPGLMADKTMWDELVPHLKFDMPVQYASLSTGDSIQSMAVHLLERSPASFVLVGFSMGGYVAREMARLAPERVRALVLIATSARGDSAEQARRKAAALR